jgi:SOS-response transcriptional repressor LexA
LEANLNMPTINKTLRIFEFIKRYTASNKQAPTMAEIGRQFDMRSSASVHQQLTKMESRGWIYRIPNVSRGIRLGQPEQTKAA